MRITKFSITNYRSLIDFKVDDFSTTTIFYGLNNAGKSNILSALSTIFKRKVQYDANVDGGITAPLNFYEGVLENFSGNYFNQDDTLTIEFSVELTVGVSELNISNEIKPLLKKWPASVKFEINGTIGRSNWGAGTALIKMSSIKLENIDIYNPNNTESFYFPTLLSKGNENRSTLADSFVTLMDPFNNCVHIIRSERDMHQANFSHKMQEGSVPLTPEMFKHFLHSLYLSQKRHSDFEEIDNLFAAEPFGFGRISFSKDSESLDVMVKENNIRLPIKSLGSGVLQILYIITEVVCHPNKIICIEEIEQNLSPKLQNQAMRKLQSMIGAKVDQIIISSHSSVFIAQKLSDAIYLIKKEGAKTVVAERLDKKVGDKIKEHIVHATVEPGTYTDKAEYDKFLTPEVKKAAEDRFGD